MTINLQSLASTTLMLLLLCLIEFTYGQSKGRSQIDLKRAKVTIDSLNKKGAKLFFDGDSVGMYNMYAKDADLEGIKGEQILFYWGERIRYAIKHDSRKMTFKTTSVSTDGEFLIDLGTYNIENSKGLSKGQGKYLIVWKQENGQWKLYRDIPL